MSKPKKRIALDMDEVIADARKKFVELIAEREGLHLKPEDYAGRKIYDVVGPERASSIRNYLFEEGFFATLEVIEDSQEVVDWLMDHYHIFITTAAMEFPNSLDEKYDWLKRHFPRIHWKNFVFCGDKSIIKADYMIDDHVKNLVAFEGKGLLYTASHNIHEKRFTRVSNWKEVRSFFEAELQKR